MSKTGRASRGIFALTATVLCFAAAYPGIIAAQANFSPAPLVLLRALIVTLALIGLAIAMQISMRISWRDLAVASVLGQLGISGFQWLLYEAQQVSSAGTASTIVNMAPVITLIASALILKEQVSAKRWLGVLIAVIGVVVLGGFWCYHRFLWGAAINCGSGGIGLVFSFSQTTCAQISSALSYFACHLARRIGICLERASFDERNQICPVSSLAWSYGAGVSCFSWRLCGMGASCSAT